MAKIRDELNFGDFPQKSRTRSRLKLDVLPQQNHFWPNKTTIRSCHAK